MPDDALQAIIDRAVSRGMSDADIRLVVQEHQRRNASPAMPAVASAGMMAPSTITGGAAPEGSGMTDEAWAALTPAERMRNILTWGGHVIAGMTGMGSAGRDAVATPKTTLAFAAAPMVAKKAGELIRPTAQAAARRLYQSALKPSKATLADVRPAAGKTAQETLLQSGLDEGVPITRGGLRKVENLIDSLDGEVQARVAQIQARGGKVDPSLVDQAIDDVVRDFTQQVNAQPELAAIQQVRQNFATNPHVAQPSVPPTSADFARGRITGAPAQTQPGPIDPVVAQRMKSNTYRGLAGKFGRELSGTIEAEKAGARGLRAGLEAAGAATGVDDIAAINAREGSLISLEHALSDALRRRGNYDVLGLKPAVGAAAAASTANALPLLVTLIDRFPGLVSRTGVWINRTGQRSGALAQRAGAVAAATPRGRAEK
jgi:hypothetical protein